MIPCLKPPFDRWDAAAVLGGLFSGRAPAAFEAALAASTGQARALVFAQGRSGLTALIEVMGWRNREIVLPAYTCLVVAQVVLATGNRPRFVDLDPVDYNMTPAGVARVLNSDTAAVLATHLYGFPMDLAGLEEVLAPWPGVALIQDCAMAPGAAFQGRPVWQKGLAALFSFSWSKAVSTLEGGAITTNRQDLAQELERYRDRAYARPGALRASTRALSFLGSWLGGQPPLSRLIHWLAEKTPLLDFLAEDPPGEAAPTGGLRERLPVCLARLGLAQLAKLPQVLAHKQALARVYSEALSGLPGLALPRPRPGASYSLFPCRARDREGFVEFMHGRGILVGQDIFDYSLPELPLFTPPDGALFPEAGLAARETVLLPTYYGLGGRDLDRVLTALARWRRSAGDGA